MVDNVFGHTRIFITYLETAVPCQLLASFCQFSRVCCPDLWELHTSVGDLLAPSVATVWCKRHQKSTEIPTNHRRSSTKTDWSSNPWLLRQRVSQELILPKHQKQSKSRRNKRRPSQARLRKWPTKESPLIRKESHPNWSSKRPRPNLIGHTSEAGNEGTNLGRTFNGQVVSLLSLSKRHHP